MESTIKMDLFSVENKLSIYEMQEIEAGKLSVTAFCAGWGTVSAVGSIFGIITGVGAVVLGVGDLACIAYWAATA